ncbi:MAG: diguanylate cyclase [Planctomycetota bacterium]
MQPSAPSHILILEDDPDTAELIQESLADHLQHATLSHVGSIAQALEQDLEQVDIVLSDMNLPDGLGLDFLVAALERAPNLPIVFVTGEGALDRAIESIRRGAYDYVVKAGDYLFTLPVVVEKNLAQSRLKLENEALRQRLEATLAEVQVKNDQLQEAVERLETMAATDPLTGLANRRSLGASLDRRFADSQRRGHDLAVVMIDLDGFKQLNDALGHQVGDQVLQLSASSLQRNCRRSDVAGRYGGDEFVLLLPEADLTHAREVAERVSADFQLAFEAAMADSEPGPVVTMSLGIATRLQSSASGADELIANADHALYAAKAAGKSRLMVYSSQSSGVTQEVPPA